MRHHFQIGEEKKDQVVYSEFFVDKFRALILDGTLAVGTKLPTLRELSSWTGADVSTIQKALVPLAAECLIKRYRRKGTFVCDVHPKKIDHLIVLRDIHPALDPSFSFYSYLSALLGERASAMGVTCEFHPLPISSQARKDVERSLRRSGDSVSKGVVVLGSDISLVSWTENLSLPVVYHSVLGVNNKVYWDYEQGARLCATWAARRKISSMGIISAMPCRDMKDYPGHLSEWRGFYEVLVDALTDFKIKVRNSWLITPGLSKSDLDGSCHYQFGRDSLNKILSQDCPEAVLVYPSSCVDGVFSAALNNPDFARSGPHLLLHRNLEIPVFPPVQASFFSTSIDQMAVALLKKLEAIAAGTDNNSPELLPFGM